MNAEAIPGQLSEKPIDDSVEFSRIDDLLLEQINILRAEIKALKTALNESEELRGRETAELRRRLAKLEQPHKPKDSKLLDELYKTMQARCLKQVDFATAARMVKRSKARMLQLKGQIGEDMRFVLVPQKNKIVIRVRV